MFCILSRQTSCAHQPERRKLWLVSQFWHWQRHPLLHIWWRCFPSNRCSPPQSDRTGSCSSYEHGSNTWSKDGRQDTQRPISDFSNIASQPRPTPPFLSTVMLITTSFIYALLSGKFGIFLMVLWRIPYSALNPATCILQALWALVFAYNFYVYLITGKQFRSEL